MKNILLIFTILIPVLATAQYSSDVLLFSRSNPTTTARGLATGNILGGLGADLSTANTNPAGLGVYRKTEIGLSIGSLSDISNGDFQTAGTAERGRLSQLSFGGIGFVAAKELSAYSDWRFVNFGLSVNRLSNFGQSIELLGESEGSRVLSFLDAAQGIPVLDLNPYESRLAYEAYLIDLDGNGTNTYAAPVIDSDIIQKRQSVSRRGGVNELGFSFAGNYKNDLYIGATVGVDFLDFRDNRIYEEQATNDTIPFVSMRFAEYRRVRGTGINLKAGFIYRINKMVRFGMSIHTPTAYRLTETYDTELAATVFYFGDLKDSTYLPEQTQEIRHDLVTPWVFSGNVGIVVGKRGFIGIEAVYRDYTMAQFSLLPEDRNPDNEVFIRNVNREIENNYTGVFSLGIGGEIALDVFRLRAGYRFESSPYQESVPNVSDIRHDISAGVGARWKHFFLDIAYRHTLRQFEYIPYASSQPQRVVGTRSTGQIMVTVGFSIFRDYEEERVD